MRFLLAMLWLCLATSGAAQDRAAQLEALKGQFPSHVAGPITDRSDPAIQRCYNKYKSRVDRLTVDNLAEEIYRLQEAATDEFTFTERRLRNNRGVLDASGKHAEQQNANWLKQKLIPYLKRIVQFQRGR